MKEIFGQSNFSNFDSHETEHEPAALTYSPPAVDTLLNVSETLPEEIRENPKLIEEAEQRRELVSKLSDLYDKIPNPTVELSAAFKDGLISEEELSQLYDELSTFLLSDLNNSRLVLYIPFEFLPDWNSISTSEKISKSEENFARTYIKCWLNLLPEKEIRASFVDGDIIENELRQGDQPVVVKAAHLIPFLVEKGLITVGQVTELYEANKDNIVGESVADTLPVLADKGIIPAEQAQAMKDKPQKRITADLSSLKEKSDDFNNEIKESLEADLRAIEAEEKPEGYPEARLKWEKEEEKRQLYIEYSNLLAEKLQSGDLSLSEIKETMTGPLALPGVIAIGKYTENIAENDIKQAQESAKNCADLLENLWRGGVQDIQDALATVWSHWAVRGIVEKDYLVQFGFELPTFDAMTPPDIEKKVKNEKEILGRIIEKIDQDPQLKEALYPALLLYGSRFKGYAMPSADLDAAIFVKPGFDWNQRAELLDLIQNISGEEGFGKVVEFWLEEHDGETRIKEMPRTENVANPDWPHVVFGGVWAGDQKVINELQANILKQYLTGEKEPQDGNYDKRAIWLRKIEREVLQYRLMHKGYGRFHPKQGGISTEHSYLIDSESDFWDSGYRRVATKLFLSKIFLPDLKETPAK